MNLLYRNMMMVFALMLGVVSTQSIAQTSGLKNHKFVQGEHSRNYLLYTPKQTAATTGLFPLVMVLHGGGSSNRKLLRLTKRRWNRLADQHGFYVVYPNALNKVWDFGADETSNDLKVRLDDLAYFRQVIDRVSAQHPIDQGRVFATGISRGGQASYFLACNFPARIKAIAPIAMSLPAFMEDDCKQGPPVAVAIFNGTHDPIVPYHGGQIKLFKRKRGLVLSTQKSIALWRERNGCKQRPDHMQKIDKPKDKTSVTRTDWTSCTGAPVTLYRIQNGGHTWPSGKQYLPIRLVGHVSKDINAADEAWNFFRQF